MFICFFAVLIIYNGRKCGMKFYKDLNVVPATFMQILKYTLQQSSLTWQYEKIY